MARPLRARHLDQPRFRALRSPDRHGDAHAARTLFGGGSKILLPGVCGRETVFFHHNYVPGPKFLEHTQEVGRIAGLQYIINPLLNPDLGIMGLVAGERSRRSSVAARWGAISMAPWCPRGTTSSSVTPGQG